jgi:hypothetical protein
MRPMIRTLLVLTSAFVATGLGAGCDEKKQSSSDDTARAEAGTDKYATADPKLEKALQTAAQSSEASDHGPPPQGVFAPGVADQRHPTGAVTTLDLVADGDEPRAAFASAPGPGADSARKLTDSAILEVSMQMGRAAMPTIDMNMGLGPARKDEGGTDWLVADVRQAIPSKEQYGQLPPGSEKDIASLEGTRIRVKVTPDGRASEEQVQLGKATRPDLDAVAQNAAEALVLLLVPLPTRPIGVGAQWIAETRMPWWGVDVIAYRAYRVKSIEGDRFSLTLSAQAYAASKDTQLQGVPKGGTLEQFEAQAQGELELVRGEPLPRKAALEERVAMFFQPPNAPPPAAATPGGEPPPTGMLTAKFQGQVTFLRGDDLRAASRR